jgi:SOS response regulatory protein OraA/RecX
MKIFLKNHSNKKLLIEIWSEASCLGVIPKRLLPFSLLQNDSADLNPDELNNLINESLLFAQDKLLDYLAMSEKTTFDCQNFLKRYHIPDHQINQLIKAASDKKYLSDERYAELFIQDAILFGKSKDEIKFKLKNKRISPHIIQNKLAELYNSEELNNILNDLIDKLINQYSDLPKAKIFDKCATALFRKGFKYSDFSSLLSKKIQHSEDDYYSE